MAELRIDIEENPDPALRDEILKPLRAFNESKVGPVRTGRLALVLRDPQSQAVTGGLWGTNVAGWLYVDLLVVPAEFRGRGWGKKLLAGAEEMARKRGCVGMWLTTGTFQSPGFYEKQGFAAFGTLADYPPGHDTIFYCKRLG